MLLACTLGSLLAANSRWAHSYVGFWQGEAAGHTVKEWINDGLMAIFFLRVGLELERELYNGELSNLRDALLPIAAAVGGVAVPAAIYFALNFGTPTSAGVGIPMATDIAFALGALALLGSRVPGSLKVYLTALAVIDDLVAIAVIALFYTAVFSAMYLLAALAVFGLLVLMNRSFRLMSPLPYLIGGVLMWFFMLKSGVHATVAGVLLAFAIPFSHKRDDEESPSHRIEHLLHKPVTFIVLPLFALANTGVSFPAGWVEQLFAVNGLGIIIGLVVGKPLGIIVATYLALVAGVCRLPGDLNWHHVVGAGLLGGIGFTMSIFITNVAFPGEPHVIDASTIAILLASLVSGIFGLGWLRLRAAAGR